MANRTSRENARISNPQVLEPKDAKLLVHDSGFLIV